jgi:hypothetical protein
MPLLARIADPNIAAIANLPDSATGLLQATGPGTATTRAINALGQTLLNTDAAGARSAIAAIEDIAGPGVLYKSGAVGSTPSIATTDQTRSAAGIPTTAPLRRQVLQATGIASQLGWGQPSTNVSVGIVTRTNMVAGTGAQVIVQGSASVPLTVAVPNGIDPSQGPVFLIRQITANQSISVASNGTTYILLANVNETNLSFSLITTSIAPIYSLFAPASPIDQQLWYSIGANRMYQWSSGLSQWISTRVWPLGYATTVSSVVTAAVMQIPAYWEAAFTAINGFNTLTIPWGMPITAYRPIVVLYDRASGAIVNSLFADAGTNYGVVCNGAASPSQDQLDLFIGANLCFASAAWQSTAGRVVDVLIRRGW